MATGPPLAPNAGGPPPLGANAKLFVPVVACAAPKLKPPVDGGALGAPKLKPALGVADPNPPGLAEGI